MPILQMATTVPQRTWLRPHAGAPTAARLASSSADREGRGCEAAGGRRVGRDKVAVELELGAELVVRHVGDASTAQRAVLASARRRHSAASLA